MRSFRPAPVLLFVFLVACYPPLQPVLHAQCGEQGNEPCELYRIVLLAEPDWCMYQFGDRVFIRSHLVGVTLTPYQWFVVSASDPDYNQLVYQFAVGGWAVDYYVVTGCQVIVLP